MPEETTNEISEETSDFTDYAPYLQSINDSLSDIKNNISDYQNDIQGEMNEIRQDIQSLKTESYFGSENMETFIPYANVSDIGNMLFSIIILLGCIFGALVFRHFRK